MQYNRLLNKKFKGEEVLIVSHRGFGGGNIVLNTISAMQNAINCGADILELDISVSSDGKFFVFHQNMEPRNLLTTKKISEMTAAEINSRSLYNNALKESEAQVPTLDQMIEFLSGKDVLINFDKCDQIGKKVLLKLDQYAVEEQILVKGKCIDQFLEAVNQHQKNYMFMPVVKSTADIEKALSYENLNIVGFEFIFKTKKHELLSKKLISELKEQGYFIWVNAINLGKGKNLSADFDDDKSILVGADAGWGKLIDYGFNVIQTDWPPLLKDYLNKRFSKKEVLY
ncbi:MAG: glycerophosphodiester phosphodiesterase family protein [bacterium]